MKGMSTGYLAKLQAAGAIASTGHPVMQQRQSHQLFQGLQPERVRQQRRTAHRKHLIGQKTVEIKNE
jgi:hypothetical protein